jgi:endonuclease III
MKNATKHAEVLRSLLKRLLKEHKPPAKEHIDPLKALVRGMMSFDVSDHRADEAMKLIDREFVDLNELRVATDLEVQELLGQKYPQIETRVAMITQSLNSIFEREQTLNLNRMKEISRRDARQFMRELPKIHPFVEAFVMLFSFDGACVPLDNVMLGWMKDQGIVEEESTLEEAQKFVEHQLKANECYELYVCVRREAREDASRRRGK